MTSFGFLEGVELLLFQLRRLTDPVLVPGLLQGFVSSNSIFYLIFLLHHLELGDDFPVYYSLFCEIGVKTKFSRLSMALKLLRFMNLSNFIIKV